VEIIRGDLKVKAEWSVESLSDLSIMMGLDVEKELEELLVKELKKEMKKEARKIPTLTGRISKIKIKQETNPFPKNTT
jgi:hypothetical protein